MLYRCKCTTSKNTDTLVLFSSNFMKLYKTLVVIQMMSANGKFTIVMNWI